MPATPTISASRPRASFPAEVAFPRPPVGAAREAATISPFVGRWLALALGSLLLSGMLSLSVVVGRLPVISRWIADPLFFKRCLVVHVDLALVVWFYAFISALAAYRAGTRIGRGATFSFILAALGIAGVVGGGVVPGAAPVLANYVPVIDHPLFLTGLSCFFIGVLGFSLRSLFTAAQGGKGALPEDAGVGIRAAGIGLALAATVWVAARSAMPDGLPAQTYFEFLHWGPGHVLQVTNVCAMIAVWLWVAGRMTAAPVLSAARARLLFGALLAPHLLLPLLTRDGVTDRVYHQGATLLMRWGIFPVALFALGLVLRHLRAARGKVRTEDAGMLGAGLLASGGLTVLGFVLGACIRNSTTLVPAHYHASLGGVTASFMVATYLLLPALGRAPVSALSARRQLLCFGLGQAVFALGFAIGGFYGLGRKAYGAEQHVRTLGEQIGLGVMGVGGLAAAAGGIWFLILVLRRLRPRRAGGLNLEILT
jgi:cytochrome c oxidase subunit I